MPARTVARDRYSFGNLAEAIELPDLIAIQRDSFRWFLENGLANAFHVAAINGGRHVAPLFAGDTVFAWSEILEKAELPGRTDVGALRVRLVATKNRPCADFPFRDGEAYDPSVILDFDMWVLIPR